MRVHPEVVVGRPIARLVQLLVPALLMTAGATGYVAAGASPSPGSTIVVAQDGSGSAATITEAVAMAHDGETVLVLPGTYAESVVIRSDITLQGDGERGSVVIQFASPTQGPSQSEDGELFGYGILLEGSDALVSNLTIQGPLDDGSDPTVSAVYIVGGAPVIDGIDVVLSGDRQAYSGGWYYRRSAVRITGGSTATISDSTWDGYVRILGEPNAPTFKGNTIRGPRMTIVDGGHEPVIRGNTFLEGAGLRWEDGGSGGILEDNDISGWIGIDASTAAANDPIIRGNRIRQGSGPGGAAIEIAAGAMPWVEANEITDGAIGILLTGSGAEPDIEHNTIRGMSAAGIRVASGASPSIEGNTIEANATGIDVQGVTTTPVIAGNLFCGNETDLAVPDGSTLTLDGNTICQPGASDAP
jgi:hypothetical protein